MSNDTRKYLIVLALQDLAITLEAYNSCDFEVDNEDDLEDINYYNRLCDRAAVALQELQITREELEELKVQDEIIVDILNA